mmetsp:Transcript_13277/g.40895  ORF Transcript_13277/g.40895 Transcript_13277/m.40895 type:complete len:214 (-) Transcript_13277:26-667(-)
MDDAPQPPTSHSLAREASLVMAARVAQQLGFKSAEESALEALADVCRYYVNTLGRRAAANARHATRSDLALNDVLAALRQSPTAATSWRDLSEFADGWRAPHGATGRTLPAPKRRRFSRYGVLGAASETLAPPRSVHVPRFLPPFPPSVVASAVPESERARDDARDVEGLQLALNRINNVTPGASYGSAIEVDDNAAGGKAAHAWGKEEEEGS